MSAGAQQIDGVAVHPAANIFPMMTESEFTDHLNSIHKNGQLDPCVMLDGKLLDGRNRWKAAKVLGKEPVVVNKTATDIPDPIAFVLAKNKDRRQLTASQRSMVAARAKEMYEAEAKKRQQAAGGKSAPSKNGKKSASNTEKTTKSASGLLTGSATGDSRDLAGKAVGVSGKSVERANKVLQQGSKSLQKAVDDGKVTVTTAAKLVDSVPDKKKQSEVVKKGSGAVKAAAAKPKKPSVTKTRTPEMKVREALEAIAVANGKYTSLKEVLGEKAWKDGRENLASVATYCETWLENHGAG